MKIFNDRISKILEVYNGQQHIKNVNKNQAPKRRDELNLSSHAKEYQVAMNALKDVPDIRKEKVEEIKKQIQMGTYEIDSDKIVEKMFDTINIDKKV
ncbi:negative regulator of flagellin synthesis, anti-sigma-28 factor FlgM [Gottschalkia purinilytica]|uniref:Negative regulator of flagellin synthesis n=1 Tax=Gottschalkia purinilytica TaxID=1503 RepID=A0A0L0WE15_GOTPU|nr:flagellar biosynthesis anti-sigma factor FlgM [Gottschalkia purinilytica]KNF09660.1 negative regulator of flagellin synthesis, anti-sigma-28 factor FlgM [Gottschalkia purinilytica]